MIFNKTLTRSLLGCALGMGLTLANTPSAKAEKVVSDSKYPIELIVLQGTCNPDETAEERIADFITKKMKENKSKQSGNVLENAFGTVKTAFNAGKAGVKSELNSRDGCLESGFYILPKKGASEMVSPGQWIIASKQEGNPWPAICQVKLGKTVTLKTIKSAKLRKMFGFSGDAGLMCDIN